MRSCHAFGTLPCRHIKHTGMHGTHFKLVANSFHCLFRHQTAKYTQILKALEYCLQRFQERKSWLANDITNTIKQYHMLKQDKIKVMMLGIKPFDIQYQVQFM